MAGSIIGGGGEAVELPIEPLVLVPDVVLPGGRVFCGMAALGTVAFGSMAPGMFSGMALLLPVVPELLAPEKSSFGQPGMPARPARLQSTAPCEVALLPVAPLELLPELSTGLCLRVCALVCLGVFFVCVALCCWSVVLP
jgi:hypothetical protein